MLDFVTELCFVAVLMKISFCFSFFFFQPFGLTMICKELALLACRLTIVNPVFTHNMYQLGFQCVRLFKVSQPLVIFYYES